MQRPIVRGAAADAGLIFHVFAMDSTSTVGAGKASIAFGSWTCRYIRNGEAISGAITPQDITTIGTYAAPTANTNIRIKAVDNTNMIGVYEIQIHSDWANTTNSCQSLTIYLTASGVAVLPLQIPLEAVNRQDSVRMGLTALPNAAAEAAGGLYTRGTGAGQIAQQASGQIDANVSTIKTQAVTCGAGVTVLASVGTAATSTAQTGDAYARIGAPAGASVSADVAAVKVDSAAVKVQTDKLTFTVANQVDSNVLDWKSATAPAMTGDAYARLGAPAGASVSADVAAVKTDSAAIKLKTDNLPSSPAAVGSAMTLTSAYDPAKTAAQAGDAMALTSGERTTLTGVIWAALTSGLTTVGSIGKWIVDKLDVVLSTRLASSSYTAPDNTSITAIKAKTDNLPTDPADASDIAGSFSTVNSTLSTIAGYIDTEVAAIKAKTDNLPSDPADASDIAASFASIASTLATIEGYVDTEVAAIKAKTDNLPTDPADASDIAASFSSISSTLSTIAGYIDTEVAAIKAKTDNLPADPAGVSDLPSVPTTAQIADKVLGRNLAGGSDSGRTVQDALRFLRNKVAISGSTITIYAEDDSTPAWTGTLTTSSSADPITAVDPA